MKRLFETSEFDKINNELMNKIYPVESLQSYYHFGAAQTLHMLTDIANQYINKGYSEQLDAYDLKKLITEMLSQNPELRHFYNRLRKEGTKTSMENMQDML
jgi:hypothetical protein